MSSPGSSSFLGRLSFFSLTQTSIEAAAEPPVKIESGAGSRATDVTRCRDPIDRITDESWRLPVRRSCGSYGYFYPCRWSRHRAPETVREAWKRAPPLHCGSPSRTQYVSTGARTSSGASDPPRPALRSPSISAGHRQAPARSPDTATTRLRACARGRQSQSCGSVCCRY